MKINFIGESYNSRDDKSELINMYSEVNTQKQVELLLGTPGLRLRKTTGANPCRGFHIVSKNESVLYGVWGKRVYKLLADLSFTEIGQIQSDQGLVSMADNGLELMIVDGTDKGYNYNLATGIFKQIPGYSGGSSVVFIDSYFVSTRPETAYMECSGLLDGLSWNGLDIASAEASSDNIITLASNYSYIMPMGLLSTEIWANAALSTGFPFQKQSGGVMEFGIAAKNSLASIFGSMFLLSRTDKGERVVFEVASYAPTIVSSMGINYQLGKMANVADAEAFSYMQEGHSFYVITFPSADLTFVYDASTKRWHRRKSFGMNRWRARCYTFFMGKHLVGDFQNGNIYELDMEYPTENGETIERTRIAPEVMDDDEGKNIIVNNIELDMVVGVGDENGSEPKAMMSVSSDQGNTWSLERWRSLGQIGKYNNLVTWNRWGQAQRRYFKLVITDAAKVVIRGARLLFSVGKS